MQGVRSEFLDQTVAAIVAGAGKWVPVELNQIHGDTTTKKQSGLISAAKRRGYRISVSTKSGCWAALKDQVKTLAPGTKLCPHCGHRLRVPHKQSTA